MQCLNRFLEKVSKKQVIAISFVGFLILSGTYFYIEEFFLKKGSYCFDYCDWSIFLSLLFLPIFLFSIIFSFLQEAFFKKWLKFTFIYLFIYFIIVVFLPFKCDAYIPICKETLSKLMTILYSGISLIFIIYHSIKSKKDLK